MTLACSENDQLLSFGPLFSDLVLVHLERPGNHVETYRPINDSLPATFVVGSMLVGNELYTHTRPEKSGPKFKSWSFAEHTNDYIDMSHQK